MTFINSQDKYYVMSPSMGTTYYGPFDQANEACEWAEQQKFEFGFRVRDGQYMRYMTRDQDYQLIQCNKYS